MPTLLVVAAAASPFVFLPNYCKTEHRQEQARDTQRSATPANNASASSAPVTKSLQATAEVKRPEQEARKPEAEQHDWVHKFFCEVKVGEWVIAVLTLVLAGGTIALAVYTLGLWRSTYFAFICRR